MTKGHKAFVWTFLAVVGGIWLWSKWTRAKATGGTIAFGPISITPAPASPSEAGVFYGPDTDPQTGAYLPPGAKPGTVSFSSQQTAN
jgi:hypothetical protein